MKKIIFFVGGMGRGGAERVVSILSDYYIKRNWQVDICMLLHNIKEYELNEKVNVIDMSYDDSNFYIAKLKMLFSLRKYVKKNSGAILVPFLAKMNVFLMLATLGINLKKNRVVTSERIDPYCVNYSTILRYLVNKSFEKADCVVFQTKRAQGFYSKKIQQKSAIIGNPVDLKLQVKKNNKHIIITAGRLVEQKNQEMLIHAFAKIASKYPEYVLHIYGEGNLRTKLEELIIALGMEQRILLKGMCSNYHEKLSEAEIFVLTSNYEGLSNALLEALLMGIPTISTDCSGVEEVIENYHNGIIIPVGGQRELEIKLDELIRDKKLQNYLADNSKKLEKIYSLENVINKWIQIFEEGRQ